jgi:hypothetical protein
MALYVKVFTSFFTCKKTIRLRALLGDDALWIPIRLWAYAAENQADGDFSEYTEQEIAMLIGYTKDASSMLQALRQAGFLDGMIIHDWDDYNSYHKAFSDRAKSAATARWSKHNEKKVAKEKKDKTREREEPSIATSMLDASQAKPASEQQVIEFCRTLGLPDSDGSAMWFKWIGTGWKNGGNPIKDWKATIRSWKHSGYMPSQKGAKPIMQQPAQETFL